MTGEKKIQRNKEHVWFINPFRLTQLPLRWTRIACQQLNTTLGLGKTTGKVWRGTKEKKKRHRRLIASPKKHTKLQNRMSVPEKISSHSFLLTTKV